MQEFLGLDAALQVDKLADQLNDEISLLAMSDLSPTYNWRVLTML